MSARSSTVADVEHVALAAGLHSVQVDAGGYAPRLGRAEREPERFARLAQRLVARDHRSAGDRDVLIGAHRVERVACAERHAAFGELRAIERRAQSDAVDLADALCGDHRHDRVGESDGQEPLLILGRETRDLLSPRWRFPRRAKRAEQRAAASSVMVDP